jgi:hypothetical protein
MLRTIWKTVILIGKNFHLSHWSYFNPYFKFKTTMLEKAKRFWSWTADISWCPDFIFIGEASPEGLHNWWEHVGWIQLWRGFSPLWPLQVYKFVDFQIHLPQDKNKALLTIIFCADIVPCGISFIFFSRKSSANRLMSPIDFENMDKASINIATVF